MAPSRTDVSIKATRVDYRSSVGYDTALSRLRASIQKDGEDTNDDWSAIAAKAYSNKGDGQSVFATEISRVLGPHSFMYFFELNHGKWLPIFDPPTLKLANGRNRRVVRYILGNPLIAITMLRYDITSGLYAPTELLLVEEDEGTKISYQLPSGLVAGYEGAEEESKKAAVNLDDKLEALVQFVLAD